MRWRKFKDKYRSRLKYFYVSLRKYFLQQWTKIPDKKRESFFYYSKIAINYLLNALIVAVPITLLLHIDYWKSVICVWCVLSFFEHYYIWLREKWKDDLVK